MFIKKKSLYSKKNNNSSDEESNNDGDNDSNNDNEPERVLFMEIDSKDKNLMRKENYISKYNLLVP